MSGNREHQKFDSKNKQLYKLAPGLLSNSKSDAQAELL